MRKSLKMKAKMNKWQRINNQPKSTRWRKLAALKPGHYAECRTESGGTRMVFCSGAHLWDVRTGNRVADVTGWRRPCN